MERLALTGSILSPVPALLDLKGTHVTVNVNFTSIGINSRKKFVCTLHESDAFIQLHLCFSKHQRMRKFAVSKRGPVY